MQLLESYEDQNKLPCKLNIIKIANLSLDDDKGEEMYVEKN